MSGERYGRDLRISLLYDDEGTTFVAPCSDCGALVLDQDVHDAWHDSGPVGGPPTERVLRAGAAWRAWLDDLALDPPEQALADALEALAAVSPPTPNEGTPT